MVEGHLAIENVVAGYGGAPVLEDVSLSVKKGEAVGVWGRNGAGKTTLLRMISGLLRPRAGRVLLDGAEVTGLPPFTMVRRGVGHVPEGRRVIPGMTVLDNLKLGGFILAATELERRLAYICDLFPLLREWFTRKAGTLSGGEQQLLALARAMMSNPRILLLDEPLTGLAPVIQARVLDALARIAGERVGILLVEQNLRQSLRVVSRGILIEQGRIVLQGTSSEMRDNPRIVEGYLGIGDESATGRLAH
jgi:branched-chain amino acid transport system ATP-binding protein